MLYLNLKNILCSLIKYQKFYIKMILIVDQIITFDLS